MLITTSPGSNKARTLSPLPYPGTTPPLAKRCTAPPSAKPPCLLSGPFLTPVYSPLPNFVKASKPLEIPNTARTGNTPLTASATLIIALTT